jgi:acylphosphatase
MEHAGNPRSSPALIQRHLFIEGLVQGVGFRAATRLEARRYPGLRGFVRNLPDGRVEAVFHGDHDPVLQMVAWCRKGPPAARVSRISVIEEQPDLQSLSEENL